jgi:drug/metabolite transporter (DMT)-like permease
MKHVSKIVGLNPMDYVQAMLNPAAAMGVGLLILWLLMRMALMSWADLSFVLPVTSGGYALSALLGTFVLHEVVSPRQWAGIALIAGGAALAGSQQQRKVE